MLKKRIIFTLLYDNGSFMLSRNFRLQKVGDMHWLKKNYNFSHISFSIDELIILDVTRVVRNEDKFLSHVKSLTEECFVPIAAGGGIRGLEQARKLLRSGADKVVINTLLAKDHNIIREIAKEFGQQSIVASVDVKAYNNEFEVWTDNGTKKQNQTIDEWLNIIYNLPIGELYLNSIDNDGASQGYKLELLDVLNEHCSIPVIFAGGAGKYSHFSEVLSNRKVDAVATAHLFNFIGNGLEDSRNNLLKDGHKLSIWSPDTARSIKNIFSM